MIKALVAFDDDLGIANEAGIPWDLPSDREHVHQLIANQPVLMGYRTYQERKGPRKNGRSFVITRPDTQLQDGFEAVIDVKSFLEDYKGSAQDIWVMGGSKVYQQLLPDIEELIVTRIKGKFGCTKFFPAFEDHFSLQNKQPEQIENGLHFNYETWRQKV